MSRLYELIEELCTDGVEYKKFNEVAKYIRGVSYNKTKEINNGLDGHKLLRANNITLESNTLNFEEVKIIDYSVNVKESQMLIENDILICAGSGSKEHIGKVAFIDNDIDYTFGGFMGVIRTNNIIINPRYMFHIMTSPIFKEHLYKVSNSSTINNINNDTWKDFRIPVPPLEVQYEIVHILDDFTLLSAELSAELKARQKQYEFYEDKLLNKDYKLIKLEKVCNICAGGTPSKSKSEYWDNGKIKWLGSTICKNKKFVDEVTGYITELGLEKSAAKLMKQKTTLIAMVGATIGKVAFLNFEATTNQNIACLYPKNENELDYACKNLYSKFVEFANGKFAMASLGFIKSLEISLPTIEEQRKIVNTLEKLDKLCNDISEGLPAEIEARQNQYEYYRDKLLNFKVI